MCVFVCACFLLRGVISVLETIFETTPMEHGTQLCSRPNMSRRITVLVGSRSENSSWACRYACSWKGSVVFEAQREAQAPLT